MSFPGSELDEIAPMEFWLIRDSRDCCIESVLYMARWPRLRWSIEAIGICDGRGRLTAPPLIREPNWHVLQSGEAHNDPREETFGSDICEN